MNAELCPAAVNTQTKPTDLECVSVCGLLSSTPTIYYYSVQKLKLISPLSSLALKGTLTVKNIPFKMNIYVK